jgi:energy-coupling factor transporter ATP-binding protein EcfA2
VVPLLLDEPLLSADPQRRATALRFLWNLSETNQVVLSTTDPAVVTTLDRLCGDDPPAVVAMSPGAATFEIVGRPVSPAALRLL